MALPSFPAGQGFSIYGDDDLDTLYNLFVDDSAGQSNIDEHQTANDSSIESPMTAGLLTGENDNVEVAGTSNVVNYTPDTNEHGVLPNLSDVGDSLVENDNGNNGEDNDEGYSSQLFANNPTTPFNHLSNDEKQDLIVNHLNDNQGMLLKFLNARKDDGSLTEVFENHPMILAHALKSLDDNARVLFKFLSKHKSIVAQFLERHNNHTVLAEFLSKYPKATHRVLDEERSIVENFLRDEPEAHHTYLDSNTYVLHDYLKARPQKLHNYLNANPGLLHDYLHTNPGLLSEFGDKHPEFLATWLQRWDSPALETTGIDPTLLSRNQCLDQTLTEASSDINEHFEGPAASAPDFLSLEIGAHSYTDSQVLLASLSTPIFYPDQPQDNAFEDNEPVLDINNMSDQKSEAPLSAIDKGKGEAVADQEDTEDETDHDDVTDKSDTRNRTCNDDEEDPITKTSSEDESDDDYNPSGRHYRPKSNIRPKASAGLSCKQTQEKITAQSQDRSKPQQENSNKATGSRKRKTVEDDNDDDNSDDDNNYTIDSDTDADTHGDLDDDDDDDDVKPFSRRSSSKLSGMATTSTQAQPAVATSSTSTPSASVNVFKKGAAMPSPHYIAKTTENTNLAYIPYPAPAAALAADALKVRNQKREWSLAEEDRAIKHMLDIRDEARIKGEKRFGEVAVRLNAESGSERTLISVKNFWNRAGRIRSGFDERRCKKAPLATSLQGKLKKKAGAVVAAAGRQRVAGRKRKIEEEEDDDDDDDDDEEDEEEEDEAATVVVEDEASVRACALGTRHKKKVKYTF